MKNVFLRERQWHLFKKQNRLALSASWMLIWSKVVPVITPFASNAGISGSSKI